MKLLALAALALLGGSIILWAAPRENDDS